jgi:hypothetical protein
MSFENTFCSSPWFHMRINNSGQYDYCRWGPPNSTHVSESIGTTRPEVFFQQHMSEFRRSMLDGAPKDFCKKCYHMEQHGKISGRQKQLLKVGVTVENFSKTMQSSPWFGEFNKEDFALLPQDWQIDLGNYCNSACVFCEPEFSTKLASEFKKLKIISNLPPSNWANDPIKLNQFLEVIDKSPTVAYIHFIGGETLITPAFKTILKTLIKNRLHQQLTIGFTTNLNCWDQEVVELLTQFYAVNLGMSIESFHPVNNYVRWPSDIVDVQQTLGRWLSIANSLNWLVQIRTTPTFLTVGKLLSIYDFAWQHGISVESCNFLNKPECLRISVLPMTHRQQVVLDMKQWLDTHQVDTQPSDTINTRNPHFSKQQLIQDLSSYVNYLETQPSETNLLPDAMQYLKMLESNRKNSILDYLPEYEELFRSAGY